MKSLIRAKWKRRRIRAPPWTLISVLLILPSAKAEPFGFASDRKSDHSIDHANEDATAGLADSLQGVMNDNLWLDALERIYLAKENDSCESLLH